ncbi:MAG: addiction module protein [Firmicutes bacterium]|nr:addiction module protein [Bacillota bacterium]
MSFEEVKAEALKLSPEFRAKLARELLVSLDALSEAEVENLWIEEAIRRDDEIDRGGAQLRPAEEVFSRAKARLR